MQIDLQRENKKPTDRCSERRTMRKEPVQKSEKVYLNCIKKQTSQRTGELTIMSAEDAVSIQTRAMVEAQRTGGEVQRTMDNNQEGGQRAVQDTREIAQDPAMNPVVEIHKNDDIIIKEYIRRQGRIGLDWYVPDFANTQLGTLVRDRVKCTTQKGRILFTCPPLNEFFPTSTFELDLVMGQIYTFLTPPEDIGIPCQQEEFDLELLARKLQKKARKQQNVHRIN